MLTYRGGSSLSVSGLVLHPFLGWLVALELTTSVFLSGASIMALRCTGGLALAQHNSSCMCLSPTLGALGQQRLVLGSALTPASSTAPA